MEIGKSISVSVWGLVRDSIRDSIGYPLKDSVIIKVRRPVRISIWVPVHESVWGSLNNNFIIIWK